MSGIFGVVGGQPALPVLLKGMERLSYRGQDGAGIALVAGGRLTVVKRGGAFSRLQQAIGGELPTAKIGLGHIRRASYGGVSDANAHPQTDSHGRFAVAHNGTLENGDELRAWIGEEGYAFASQTDTEVIAHLLARFWRGDVRQCVRDVTPHLRGAFAFAILSREAPDAIVCVRRGSPLMIGVTEGSQYVASDVAALLPFTSEIVFLRDEEIAVVTEKGCAIFEPGGRPVLRSAESVGPARAISLGGFANHMIKEISEQPAMMRAAIDCYTSALGGRLALREDKMPLSIEQARQARRLWLIGGGSAYRAALVGKATFERLARIPVEADMASEFRHRAPLLMPGDVCVFLGQSGEVVDTLAAQKLAAASAPTIGILGAQESPLSREMERALYTLVGPETSACPTKGYTGQLLALTLLSVYIACARGEMDERAAAEALGWLSQAPAQAEGILHDWRRPQRLAMAHQRLERICFIGKGVEYALAQEAAQMLREAACVQSEAFAAGEFSHRGGTLVGPGVLVIALAMQPGLSDQMIASIGEAQARGADVVALTLHSLSDRLSRAVGDVIDIPDVEPISLPMLGILPLQLFAYHLALARGVDVDRPCCRAEPVAGE